MAKKKASLIKAPGNPRNLIDWMMGTWSGATPHKLKYQYCRGGPESFEKIAQNLAGKRTKDFGHPFYSFPLSWQDITLLNFGTIIPAEINWYLDHFNGCGNSISANGEDYVLDSRDDLPWLWIPAFPNRTSGLSGTNASLSTQLINIQLDELSFTSDHKVICDNSADWENTGTIYSKPDWSPSQTLSNPITHTKGQRISVRLKITVSGRTNVSLQGQLNGECNQACMSFSKKITLQPGTNTVDLTAEEAISDNIAKIQAGINWAFATIGYIYDLGWTGRHTVYAIYGKPYGSLVTVTRINQVVHDATGKGKEEECVSAIFDAMLRYKYSLGAPYPSPVWRVYDGRTMAECNALADLFMKSCQMLGLPDHFVLGHIYPLRNKADGKFDISGFANDSRNVATTHHGYSGPSHGTTEGIVFRDFSDRTNPSNGWNNFEGCVRYKGSYYCIGEGRYASPTETMRRMVVATAWYRLNVDFCKTPGPFPEAVWNTDRWNAIAHP